MLNTPVDINKYLLGNCKGLGNPSAVRALCELINSKYPKIVFLYETKLSRGRVRRLKDQLGVSEGVPVDCQGRSGGLVLRWKEGWMFACKASLKFTLMC